MAFNNSITARYDELRSPNPPSNPTTGATTPSRYSGSFMQSHSQSFNDTRASLQRRQTTDLSKMPPITPIGQQPTPVTQGGDSVDMVATVRSTPSHFSFRSFANLLFYPIVIICLNSLLLSTLLFGDHGIFSASLTDNSSLRLFIKPSS